MISEQLLGRSSLVYTSYTLSSYISTCNADTCPDVFLTEKSFKVFTFCCFWSGNPTIFPQNPFLYRALGVLPGFWVCFWFFWFCGKLFCRVFLLLVFGSFRRRRLHNLMQNRKHDSSYCRQFVLSLVIEAQLLSPAHVFFRPHSSELEESLLPSLGRKRWGRKGKPRSSGKYCFRV